MYHVKLYIHNTGMSVLLFDKANGAFITSTGEGIGWNTYPGEVLEGKQFATLKTGEEIQFEYETDGYTQDLLNAAGGGPLYFQFALFISDLIVAGPFRAPVPSFENLTEEGIYLDFRSADETP
jgi:hypothetical protein